LESVLQQTQRGLGFDKGVYPRNLACYKFELGTEERQPIRFPNTQPRLDGLQLFVPS